MKIFILGFLLFSGLLGFLVGASESPVAGVVLTAAIGFVASLFSLKPKAATPDDHGTGQPAAPQPQPPTDEALRRLGSVLITFAVAFAVGLSLGQFGRHRFHQPDQQVSLPWMNEAAPKTARKAVDWIVARQKLKALGYTDEQILAVYRIEATRKKKSDESPLDMPSTELVSPLLVDAAKASDNKDTIYMARPQGSPWKDLHPS